jgi:hypothetical protein
MSEKALDALAERVSARREVNMLLPVFVPAY